MILNKCKSLFTCPKLLGDVEALVTDYGEACVGRGRPLNKLQMRTNKGQLTSKPGEWRSHCPQRWQPPFVIIFGFIVWFNISHLAAKT